MTGFHKISNTKFHANLSRGILVVQCKTYIYIYIYGRTNGPVLVGPCHHGMARPQVADRGTASDKEGSCE